MPREEAVIGCDPGVNGGLSALSLRTGAVLMCESFTGLKEKDLVIIVRRAASLSFPPPPFWLEKVGYMPGDGGQGAFTFGRVYGYIKGVARTCDMTIFNVTPMMWQSRLDCLTGGNKNISKQKAIALFPDYHKKRARGITHAIADSLLIAEYGRRLSLARAAAPRL